MVSCFVSAPGCASDFRFPLLRFAPEKERDRESLDGEMFACWVALQLSRTLVQPMGSEIRRHHKL